MKVARFLHEGREIGGRLEDGMLASYDGRRYDPSKVRWLPPCRPQNIIGLVLNYADHADELGLSITEDPVIFMKPTSALLGHLEPVVRPKGARFMHFEGELAVVIGSDCRKATAESAMEHVWGYAPANDLTVRDYITNTFRPPIRAKGFDTFCPIGPYLTTADEISNPGDLSIETRVNGEARQESSTRMFLHSIPKVIAFISSFMTLRRGDVILTGTPKGISPLVPGDVVEVTVEKCGTLRNGVVDET